MKKTTFFTSFLLFVSLLTFGQSADTTKQLVPLEIKGYDFEVEFNGTKGSYSQNFDDAFNSIAKGLVSTGILYDRVYPVSGLDKFNQEKPGTSNYDHFIQAYSEIQRASYSKDVLPTSVETFSKNIDIQLSSKNSTIPLGFIHFRFNTINSKAKDKGYLQEVNGKYIANEKTLNRIFETNDVIVATPIVKSHRGNEVTFKFDPAYVLTNIPKGIKGIEVDFEDGNGFQSIDINKSQEFKINYSDSGVKNVVFKIEFSDGSNETTIGSFTYEKSAKNYYPQGWAYDDEVEFSAGIMSYLDYDGKNFPGKGQVSYIYANPDKILRKPIIIIDGIDFEDSRNSFGTGSVNGESRTSLLQMVNEPYGFAYQLLSQGFDIVFLNFPQYLNNQSVIVEGGADFIERNAYVLIKLIQDVNSKLATNGSTNQLVIVGPSMGGQVSRYALAYMEKSNQPHNTRLWVSFDSPHLGANINLGAQAFAWLFATHKQDEDAKRFWNKSLMSPAAKQMLLVHLSNHPISGQETTLNGGGPFIYNFPTPASYYRTKYVNNLNLMGYPSNLRKIAVANGSQNSTPNNSPCTLAHEMRVTVLGATLAFSKIWTGPSYGNTCKVYDGRSVITTPQNVPIHWWDISINQTSNSNSTGLDVSPGSTYPTFYKLYWSLVGNDDININQLYFSSHTFMPTKTALAYSGTNQNLSQNLTGIDLVATGQTPFDSYWAPFNKNMDHVTFDPSLIGWLTREFNGIPQCPTVSPVNTLISGPEFICSNILVHPKSIDPTPTGAIYSIVNLPARSKVQYTWWPLNALKRSTIQPMESNKISLDNNSTTQTWVIIYANITLASGCTYTISKAVSAGKPMRPNYISGMQDGIELRGNSTYEFSTSVQGASSYDWRVIGGIIQYGQDTETIGVLTNPSDPDYDMNFSVSVASINSCGISNYYLKSGVISAGSSGGGITKNYSPIFEFSLSPIPTKDYLTVTAKNSNEELNSGFSLEKSDLMLQVRIFDWNGYEVLRDDFNPNDGEIHINTSQLKQGKYIVKIFDKEESVHTQQIIVE